LNLSRRRAVSPIIATLLLIAIAVAAGVLVYVYVNSLSGNLTSSNGNQVTHQLQLQAYTYNVGGVATGQLIDFYIENVGGASVTISAIYFDGTPLTEWTVAGGNYAQYLMVPASAQSCFAAIPSTANIAVYNLVAQSGTGTGTACSGGPTACNTANAFCVNTASAQAETLTLTAQQSNQFVIGLNHASAATSGTTHTIKILTSAGGVSTFSVVAGRTG
jgi:flagellin-like protein